MLNSHCVFAGIIILNFIKFQQLLMSEEMLIHHFAISQKSCKCTQAGLFLYFPKSVYSHAKCGQISKSESSDTF